MIESMRKETVVRVFAVQVMNEKARWEKEDMSDCFVMYELTVVIISLQVVNE